MGGGGDDDGDGCIVGFRVLAGVDGGRFGDFGGGAKAEGLLLLGGSPG